MAALSNPFHTPDLTETIKPATFVELFSPLLIPDTLVLFRPGNVVLKGIQGTGKSMLLNLLKPEIRIAYDEADAPFPVPEADSVFLGAGINITRSGALDFGQRSLDSTSGDDLSEFPILFGDFLNYWIATDILDSVDRLRRHRKGRLADTLEFDVRPAAMDGFARELSRDPCWFDYLDDIGDYRSLRERLAARIRIYRDFLNLNRNRDTIPSEIRESKTRAGEPISVVSQTLWSSGIIPEHVSVFIRIDQYEQLARLENRSEGRALYGNYRAIIHRILGMRDPRVSYRIGTRRHAWDEAPGIYGSTAILEELRDYRVVDLDDILRREETKRGPFASFAEDVFERRIRHEGYRAADPGQPHIKQVLGSTLSSRHKAKMYAKTTTEFLRLEDDWPDEVKECLRNLATRDPLSAKLGEAWIRQQIERPEPRLPTKEHLPWEDRNKPWWKKERIGIALLQIAARQRQRMIWASRKDVLDLSWGNILVFVSLCQHIWSAWLRSRPNTSSDGREALLPLITDPYIQNDGIQLASTQWFAKIRQDSGGDSRQRFVRLLGNFLRSRLRDDEKMSYPGESGFSVSFAELEGDPEVRVFLREAAAFGVLVDRRHTSKSRHARDRVKWYLNPIYCPYFDIPATHTKEPMYVTANDVREWLVEAKVFRGESKRKRDAEDINSNQLSLFDRPHSGR